VAFGDARSILDKLQDVERARRAGDARKLAALAIEAQDAMTWGVAKNLISVTEFERAKAHLRRLVGVRR
jgi:hypothetical protein